MKQTELNMVLKKHNDWLRTRFDENVVGKEANLQEANLRFVCLERANLQGANLQEADLQETNLRGADLQGANLQGADLRFACLERANLQEANLQGAVLYETRLQNARNLGNANLQYIRNFYLPLTCPEKGSFIGFKCARKHIVELEILTDARRSSATGRKCRCDKAKVLSITEKKRYENNVKTNKKQLFP